MSWRNQISHAVRLIVLGDALLPETETVRRRAGAYRPVAGFCIGSALLVLGSHIVDVIHAGGPAWSVLGVRLVWAASLFLIAWTLLTRGSAAIRLATAIAAVTSVASYVVILLLTGRSQSPFTSYAYVLLMVLPILVFERPLVALFTSASVPLALWTVLHADGVPSRILLGWIYVGCVAFALAWLLAWGVWSALRAEERQHIERRTAMDELAAANRENSALVDELRLALARVKTLSGLLPMCAWCKRVRTTQGDWERIEAYLTRHSDATLSHGFCPDCSARHYDQPSPPPHGAS